MAMLIAVAAGTAPGKGASEAASGTAGWLAARPLSAQVLEASPEVARRAAARLDAFLARPGPGRIGFDAVEVESLLRYSLAEHLPPAVRDPEVELGDGEAVVSFRVPRRALPPSPALAAFARFLPDTIPVRVEGTIVPVSAGRVAVAVRRMEAARMPVPSPVIAELLRAAGARGDDPPLTYPVILPPGLRSAYLVSGTLFLVAEG